MRNRRSSYMFRGKPERTSRRSHRESGIRVEHLEERRLLAADPVISEFSALNTSLLADEDGEFSDWLEVANLGDEAISLAGWHLTDSPTDLTKWTIPDVELRPGEHRVLFASGKDRAEATAPLHTNFRLASEGEFLALVEPDGNTVAFAYRPEYPEQVADVTYGLYGAEREQGYFEIATPGQPNSHPSSPLPPQAVMISELMYHPASENDAEEFIELTNFGTQVVDMSGWRISGGVDIVLPATQLPPGQSLVIAADLAAFQATYGQVSSVVGPWTGRLSNSGETVTLRDAESRIVDRVEYADEGEWALRMRGPDDRGHTGWIWADTHDGGGSSLELVNPQLPNEQGQNWLASTVVGGTPGMSNSVASNSTAPLLLDVQHTPAIPRAEDTVHVQARVRDEGEFTGTVTLMWRIDGDDPFTALVMRDDGLGQDQLANDGLYHASLPPQPDRTVVEYYVGVSDSQGHERTWPAATADAGQVTNALYQVIDEFDASASWEVGDPPRFYQIMTSVERAEFTAIDRLSDAQMNATFIRVDSGGIDLRHNAGIRIRGSGSRSNTPPNNRVNLPSDRPIDGQAAFNFNVNNVYNQVAGSLLFRLAGIPTAEANGVEMFSNGVDLRGGQHYALLEPLNSNFAQNHFPLDDNGNLYKGRRPNESPPGGLGAGLAYFGPDPAPYVSYTKLTNESQADWSDVIELTDVLNNASDEEYLERLAQVVDVDQWLRFFAMNALVSNSEGGLVNGDRLGDDYAMYRGELDPRFIMVPHDLDSVLSQVQRSILTPLNVPALRRLLLHEELRHRYYDQLYDLIDNVFLADETEDALRQAIQGLTSESEIDRIVSFLRDRSEYVKSVIPRGLQVESALPQVDGRVTTDELAMGVWGTADYRANSVLVNGQLAQFTTSDNTWQLGSSIANLVPWGSNWSYLDNGTDAGTAWREVDFVPDAAWKSGAGEFGYGDGDEQTVVSFGDDPANRHITTYFRHEFDVPDPSRWASLILQVVRDDGIVVYLNGQRVARNNIPSDVETTYQTLALNEISGGAERSILTYNRAPELLRSGKNVLAVEIHQSAVDGPDISFNARLYGRYNPPNTGARFTPGLNSVVVQAMTGVNGTGDVVATDTIEVWYDDGDTQSVSGTLPAGQTTWAAADGPFHVTGNVFVPPDATLVIEPGTSVYFDANTRLEVRGTLVAQGTDQARIRLTSVPGLPAVPDLPGLPDGPARWDGVRFVDSRSDQNVIAFADIEYAQDSNGSVGVINSNATLDHLTIKGTHLRMVYANNASMVVSHSDFPDMFAPDEDPAELGLDNVAEHIKIIGRTPAGGQLIIQGNHFGINKGHNDVIDADSNRVEAGPILQILDNTFTATGDELLDLGGDVYVAGNVFRGVSKDDSTSDRGYANAISTGDAGRNTTIVATRNVFYDVDHAINLRNYTSTIFEYNTVVNIHGDFNDRFGHPNVGSAINLYVDEPGATPGSGAYVAHNIFWDGPRVFGNADLPDGQMSALQFHDNVLSSELAESEIGQRNLTTIDLGSGNVIEDPRLGNVQAGDFTTSPGSPSRRVESPLVWGAEAPAAIWVRGVPAGPIALGDVSLTIGGPGLFAYRYRISQGDWSDPLPVGDGFNPAMTQRTAKLDFAGLTPGEYVVDLEGRDFAGNWNSIQPATVRWTVEVDEPRVLISEFLADNQTTLRYDDLAPDLIELYNAGSSAVNLRGWQLSDNPEQRDRFVFSQDRLLQPGQYLTLYAAQLDGTDLDTGFSLSRSGEALYLSEPDGTLADYVEFGLQVPDKSLARQGDRGAWVLSEPTFGAANQATRLGDLRQVTINEWLATSADQDDFVELHNGDLLPVSLGGAWLSDAGDGTPLLHQLAPHSFIQGNGFAVFWATGKSNGAADELDFQLSSLTETLQLSAPDGTPIDTIAYRPQTKGVSQGRIPDGTSTIQFQPTPTPGWINGAGIPGDIDQNTIVDAADIDLLCQGVRRLVPQQAAMDLNRDDVVDLADVNYLVGQILGTRVGDSNLDGIFNSADLVLIFQAGEYEDNRLGNSTWATGDWNCSGDFGTDDLIVAFQVGGYSAAATSAAISGTSLPAVAPRALRTPETIIASRLANSHDGGRQSERAELFADAGFVPETSRDSRKRHLLEPTSADPVFADWEGPDLHFGSDVGDEDGSGRESNRGDWPL